MPGTRPLAEMAAIRWETVSLGYGRSATDVPGLLYKLRDGSWEEPGDAEHALWGAVLHQGSVCPATAVTLPFVIGVLADGSRERGSWLTSWLADLRWVFEATVDGDVLKTRALPWNGRCADLLAR